MFLNQYCNNDVDGCRSIEILARTLHASVDLMARHTYLRRVAEVVCAVVKKPPSTPHNFTANMSLDFQTTKSTTYFSSSNTKVLGMSLQLQATSGFCCCRRRQKFKSQMRRNHIY